MSYEDLVDDIIDNQKNVMGEAAVDVAEDTPGIRLNGETVESVDRKESVAMLVDNYEDQLGQAALSSLRIAASDYAGDLDLPEKLEM